MLESGNNLSKGGGYEEKGEFPATRFRFVEKDHLGPHDKIWCHLLIVTQLIVVKLCPKGVSEFVAQQVFAIFPIAGVLKLGTLCLADINLSEVKSKKHMPSHHTLIPITRTHPNQLKSQMQCSYQIRNRKRNTLSKPKRTRLLIHPPIFNTIQDALSKRGDGPVWTKMKKYQKDCDLFGLISSTETC